MMRKLLFKDKLSLVISTLFGVGYTPLCPGTASCVVALLVFLLVKSQALFLFIIFISLLFAFSLSGRAEKVLGKKDAKQIVIDDFSGMLLTYLFVPPDTRLIIAGFFIFRMFDMLKIPPADRVEKYPGALGIVGDDLVAGIYANILLRIVGFFL